MYSCFLSGRHDAPDALQPAIKEAAENHIRQLHVLRFIVGNRGHFDAMAAQSLIQLKDQYPQITLEILLPYHPSSVREALPKGFDAFYYPFDEPVPARYAIASANRKVLRVCSHLIICASRIGHTGKLLEQARRREARGLLHITQL